MMLEHLGEPDAAAAVLAAVETVLARGGDTLTPDMGGTATTETLGKAVADAVAASRVTPTRNTTASGCQA